MKRKYIAVSILTGACLILAGGCSREQKQTETQTVSAAENGQASETEKTAFEPTRDEEGNIIYSFRDAKITLPARWEGRYDVVGSDGYIGFWLHTDSGADHAPGVARTSGKYLFGVHVVKEQFGDDAGYYSAEHTVGETQEGLYMLYYPTVSESIDMSVTEAKWDLMDDIEWIVEHAAMEQAQQDSGSDFTVVRKELPGDQTGEADGIFVDGCFENDEDMMRLCTEEGELYDFYCGGAETPYKFDVGDRLCVKYQGGRALSIVKLTDSGEPELEEQFFEGTVESEEDKVVTLRDADGNQWVIDLRSVQYMPYIQYEMDEEGNYIKDEAGNYIPAEANCFEPGQVLRVCYRGSREEPLFVGINR